MSRIQYSLWAIARAVWDNTYSVFNDRKVNVTKLIQRGTVTISAGTSASTSFGTAIDAALSEALYMGQTVDTAGAFDFYAYFSAVTNTAITATRNSSGAIVTTIAWQVTSRHA